MSATGAGTAKRGLGPNIITAHARQIEAGVMIENSHSGVPVSLILPDASTNAAASGDPRETDAAM